jgi:hypothetical protein
MILFCEIALSAITLKNGCDYIAVILSGPVGGFDT